MEKTTSPFLTGEWQYLAMLNYEIDPGELLPFVPKGTELDQWQGKTFVSVVAFRFANTRVLGFSIPFHSNFEEVNLRFYVKRQTRDGPRRAVVFIKEIVPRHAIAWMARLLYNENYIALPMRHDLQRNESGSINKVTYEWFSYKYSNILSLSVKGEGKSITPGSCEEFITEHYWGYARQRDGGTMEYEVQHPPWKIWSAQEIHFQCDVEGLYGKTFSSYIRGTPASVFLAEGSTVTVFKGIRLA